MASPKIQRETRYFTTTTLHTTFQNGAAAGWDMTNATVQKMRLAGMYDASGLVQDGIPDDTLHTRLQRQEPPIPGLRVGSLKLATYLAGAYSNITTPPEAQILADAMGGVEAPGIARSGVVLTGCSTTNILMNTTVINVKAGQALLIGTRGDARGNGFVYPVKSLSGDGAILKYATQGAPTAGDAIVVSTTVYFDETSTQKYMDAYGLGKAAADQRQVIGGAIEPTISGTGPSELPKIELEIKATDHRHVPADERDTLSTVAPDGQLPAFSRGMGLFHLGDYQSGTVAARKSGEFTATLGVSHESIPDPSGPNGMGGWQRVKMVPSLKATVLYDEDMIGLQSDYEAQTAKTAVLQLGHTATRCAAIEYGKCYVAKQPIDKDMGALAAVEVDLQADEDQNSDALQDSAAKVHCF